MSMPQLRAQWLTLRCAAICLMCVLGVLAVMGPRWVAWPFALGLLYTFTMPLIRFAARPFAWAMPYMQFVPRRVIGENIIGRSEPAVHIIWHRFGLAGIIAVLAATALCVLNDRIHREKENGNHQSRDSGQSHEG